MSVIGWQPVTLIGWQELNTGWLADELCKPLSSVTVLLYAVVLANKKFKVENEKNGANARRR
jgi:hypothetical protein